MNPERVRLALRLAALTTLLLLVAQYLLGLWTSAYAPGQFTATPSYPPLVAHYGIGYALAVASLVVLILAALSGSRRLQAPAVGLIIGVALAAVFGLEFVRSAPNNPIDSFAMGLMFLVAFGAAMNLSFSLMRSGTTPAPSSPSRA
jgi:heme A synthase